MRIFTVRIMSIHVVVIVVQHFEQLAADLAFVRSFTISPLMLLDIATRKAGERVKGSRKDV